MAIELKTMRYDANDPFGISLDFKVQSQTDLVQ